MEKKILGVHHISVKACGPDDYEKTVKFYHEILGMPIVRTWGEGSAVGTMLDTGAGLMEIFANGEACSGQGAIRHMAFAVKDVDACVEAVREAGYQITVEPKDIVIKSTPPYPARIAFCIGPVGEEIEFFAEK